MRAPSTIEEIEILHALAIAEARESFWAFRQYIGGEDFKVGWFQRRCASALQQFYKDYMQGLRPKVLLETPPQHGKSRMVRELCAWILGKNPDDRFIYASFSHALGVQNNMSLQRIIDSPRYRDVFPDVRIGSERSRERAFNIDGHDGYFRNTTVDGAVTGESADVLLPDDLIKGRKAAGSKLIRNVTWNWFTDDLMSRLSERGAVLSTATRWHVDDPCGRMRERLDGIQVYSFPAIAEQDEQNRKAGEALFEEHKSLSFLLEHKNMMAAHNWASQYQQRPYLIGGEIINGEWFGRYKELPPLEYRAIFADTAQKTGEHNDYSVFEVWGKGQDGRAYLIDIMRGRWPAYELKRRAIDFWHKHAARRDQNLGELRGLRIEDAVSGTGLIQDLQHEARMPVTAITRPKPARSKASRLDDVLGFIESGYVMLPDAAPFVDEFISECEEFTADDTHLYDDQVDPMIDALAEFMRQKMSIYELDGVWE